MKNVLMIMLLVFSSFNTVKADTCEYLGGDINEASSWSCNKAPTYDDAVTIASQPLVIVNGLNIQWGGLVVNPSGEFRLIQTNLFVSSVDCNGTLYIYPNSKITVDGNVTVRKYAFLYLYPLGEISGDVLYNYGIISKAPMENGAGVFRYNTIRQTGSIIGVVLIPNDIIDGDINGDNMVNLIDFSIMAENWLN